MSVAGAIRAGLAYVELFLDDKRLKDGLANTQKMLKSFSAGITAMGVASTAAGAAIEGGMAGAIGTFVSVGDQLEKMSIRTGMTVEQLSLLGYAAGQSDASLEDVAHAARHMATFLQSAGVAGSEAAQHLENVGLKIEDLKKLHPDELFTRLGKAIAEAPLHDFDRNAAAVAAFGRGGLSLIPMLKELDDLTKEGTNLGLIVSAEDAKNAVKLGDAWDRLTKTFKAGVFNVGAALGPDLNKAIDAVQQIATKSLEWLKTNRDIAKQVAIIGAILLGIGATILVIKAGVMLGILTPFTLVAAAVATVAYQLGLLDDTVANVKGGFAKVLDEFTPAYNDAVKAIQHGQLQLAWDLMIAHLQVSWHEGWLSMVKDVIDAFNLIVKQIKVGWLKIQVELSKVGIGQGTGKDLLDSSLIYRLITGKTIDPTKYEEQKTPNATREELEASLRKAEAERDSIGAPAASSGRHLTAGRMDPRTGDVIRPGPRDFEEKDRDAASEARKRVADLQAQLAALPPLSERARSALPDVPDLIDKTKTGALGTFSGTTATQLFGSADVGERTARGVERLVAINEQFLRNGGPFFTD